MTAESRWFRSVDLSGLPKHFDSLAAETRWDETWQQSETYHYDPSRPREESFVVDTPPPTASGSLHPGHVFSYTHTDILVRYKRMRGLNIFYPMGWDDNGLPTERRVQNYYHVRCNPKVPQEPELSIEPATSKARKKPPREVSRANFIELCHRVTAEDEQAFMTLWKRLGLSVDWRQEYQTIDDHCRRIAQLSFRDLFEKGHLYSSEAPTMWDVDFQCAVAQAETEDRPTSGTFHDIRFGVEGSGQSFVISTTRPELLPACVGVTAHPGDQRYADLFGKRAVTPLFRAPVPIFPSELADPEKGTGVLMVCTFGDATDVIWWREQALALREIMGRNGRLTPVRFGDPDFESLDAEAANRYYGQLVGENVAQARRRIVELLAEPGGAAAEDGPPLQGEPRPVQHTVKYYEKGERPLELVSNRQWFVRLLDKKQALIAMGERIQWHPAHMGKRFRDWTENLASDWCVSRQRYFGVPIPAWYPLDDRGAPIFDAAMVAEPGQMPMDPMENTPPGYQESQRNQPGGFRAEPDIFDTWFTSSMTPQLSSHWRIDPGRHATLFPADLRPQGQDIIRTWAFYTIAKALLHEDSVPWHHAAISGWILDPDRKKMSKSKGNVVTPLPMIDNFTADGVRYWAGSARLGVDTALDEKVYKIGKRLVTKIFNASKFVLSQTAPVHPISSELDRAFIAELRRLVVQVTESFEKFDHAHALMDTESFFWNRFTDTYIELSKTRARSQEAGDEAARGSAVASLRLGLNLLLRLFAPFMPYITEEVWSWVFAEETGHQSIHRAPWPRIDELEEVAGPADAGSFEIAVLAQTAINKAKTEAKVSMGREVRSLTLLANPASLERLRPVLSDVLAATRCDEHRLEPRSDLEEATFEVTAARFVER